MKILIIDRDELAAQMISSRLEEDGHEIVTESVKNEALERLEKEDFDVVFVDPAPMRDVRAMAMNIRRAARTYPYILLMSHDEEVNPNDVLSGGCNDYILKPLDPQDIHKKIINAGHFKTLMDRLGDTSEDFPSAGGIIAKSAFNQLYLSAIDRGSRYHEHAFVLSIAIDNFKEIKDMDGAYNAEYSISKLAYHLVRMRRQSDIIGQTKPNEYSLLLQRVQGIKEAQNAANRFAVTLDEIDDFLPSEGHDIQIHITLTALPTGEQSFDHVLTKKLTLPAA
ncbi:MAG: response regulator [Alphaproteobacteria bacterium]|nr:response regulator [Alphaproteobacteria bacterium]